MNKFDKAALGTIFINKETKEEYILRQLPIKKSGYEPRVKYLLNRKSNKTRQYNPKPSEWEIKQ